jgi:LysR family transcriptional activator of mexEF-oprN operon
VSFAGDLSGFIDEELEKLGRKRHVVLAVPQFNGLSTLLAGTDIVATVPDYTADALTAAGGVRAEDPPLPTRTFELHMAWRGSQDNDPGSAGCGRGFRCSLGTPIACNGVPLNSIKPFNNNYLGKFVHCRLSKSSGFHELMGA